MNQNIKKHCYQISKNKREKLHGHKALFILFTGLSGSGKSTLANMVEIALFEKGASTYILDGDNIRSGINKDLNFTPEDRTKNIRRIAEIGSLMLDAGIITLATFISPFEKDREVIKEIISPHNYIEIYVNTSLEECERRDVKGLYRKARAGEIKNMTGISSPYEAPTNPEIEVYTERQSIKECVKIILEYLNKKIEPSL